VGLLQKGKIFNIQHYSIHDGPGIRTTVFFKGCPLNCWWCHNPESIEKKSQLIYRNAKCIGCRDCINLCLERALTFGEKGVIINKDLCTLCGLCAEKCPTNALELIGKDSTVKDIMKEIEKDKMFFDESGGGVTFSGGEPLFQPELLISLLDACKNKGIHTALDTSGYARWETLESVAGKVDLFLYDLKHMDNAAHKKYTGVPNTTILENLAKLSKIHQNIWIRVPIIPGINDSEENIKSLGEFISSLMIKKVFLLPYHEIAAAKYELLDKTYLLGEVQPPKEERMEELKKILSPYVVDVKIGG
jgi:pyruvate formate lyase activating enzyme